MPPRMQYGMTAVAGLCLHDRAFFDQLLADPQRAIEQRAEELGFDQALAQQVVDRFVEARRQGHSNPIDLWDYYKGREPEEVVDWPTLWPDKPFRRSP